jgi:transglutaminase-like putative cysteine protease
MKFSMKRRFHPVKSIGIAALSLLFAVSLLADNAKTYDATYTATLSSIPDGVKKLTVWIPLPVTRGAQTVSDVAIDSPYKWEMHGEDEFGNRYATTTIDNPPAGDLSVKVRFTATRREETMAHPFETSARKADIERALRADKLVTISPRVRELANTLTAGKTAPIEQARAIYDYLVTTMTYDKVTPGWGHGDTERACDVKKGNCTDFHSLFISLARAKGIPARFVIGFPLTAADGNVKGYHCWAEFYVKGRGWIPVDASDASKTTDANVRNYLFGNLDPARVQFTVGRDLNLTPRTSEPLNFFIYPHAEASGVEIGSPSIALQFRAKS